MATKHEVILITLSALTGSGGSFTAAYPTGRSSDDFLGGTDHQIHTQSYRALYSKLGDFSISFGASLITVTNTCEISLALGTKVWLNLDRAEISDGEATDFSNPAKMMEMKAVKIALGAPAASVATAVAASQAATALAGLATGINGTLAAGGVATFDVPRNVVAAWTGTAVLTVTGTDSFGTVIVESSASGTTMTGKKAFKTVTGVSVSADVTGLTIGNAKVLGLPVFLADVPDVVREIDDGAVATAGTVVAGVTAAPTATTGDCRGTYAPNGTPNGTKVFELIVFVRQPNYRGVAA